jgi:hypothetical protein
MKSLPDARQSATHRQGLWRFLSNEKVTPGKLGAPLLAQAQQASEGDCDNYVLIMHDWSRINYNRHTSKRDRVRMTHESDLGYELQSSLAVSDRHGAPLGAVAQNLVTSEAILSSWREPTCRPPGAQGVPNHLDELTERISWLEQNGPWPLPLVHIVDREADSVGHLRQWTAAGQKWLVRTKATRRVRLGREERKVEVIARELDYRLEQQIEYQGQRCGQWVAECPVVLARPARPKRLGPDGRRVPAEPGEPIKVRLVVSRLENTAGQVLATWYLLSNLPSECTAATLSLWYYYRWRIESYFKLLKQGGQQLEHWEQESGEAIFKRLLIASAACALTWRLMREQGEYAEAFKRFLVRLSGRQTKRARPVTAPAVLAGLNILFAMLDVLALYSIQELHNFARFAFPDLYQQRWGDV